MPGFFTGPAFPDTGKPRTEAFSSEPLPFLASQLLCISLNYLGLGLILAALFLQGKEEREKIWGTEGTLDRFLGKAPLGKGTGRRRPDPRMLQKPRGTRDFLPDEMEQRREIEGRMREIGRRWGYREVCTPEFEELELFTVRSGEGIIQEMYVFEDKGGRMMSLRPELTAPVLRMYVNEGRTLP